MTFTETCRAAIARVGQQNASKSLGRLPAWPKCFTALSANLRTPGQHKAVQNWLFIRSNDPCGVVARQERSPRLPSLLCSEGPADSSFVTAGERGVYAKANNNGFQFELAVHLAHSMRPNLKMEEKAVGERKKHSEEEARILDLLARGLSNEFPNAQRVGCPPFPRPQRHRTSAATIG